MKIGDKTLTKKHIMKASKIIDYYNASVTNSKKNNKITVT